MGCQASHLNGPTITSCRWAWFYVNTFISINRSNTLAENKLHVQESTGACPHTDQVPNPWSTATPNTGLHMQPRRLHWLNNALLKFASQPHSARFGPNWLQDLFWTLLLLLLRFSNIPSVPIGMFPSRNKGTTVLVLDPSKALNPAICNIKQMLKLPLPKLVFSP